MKTKDCPSLTERERKRKKRESAKIITNFYIFGIIALICSVIAIVQVFKLSSGERGDRWELLEKNHRKIREKTIAPKRGNIYASTGELLRVSVPQFTMTFDFRSPGYNALCGEKRRSERKVLNKLSQAVSRSIPRLCYSERIRNKYIKKWLEYSKVGHRGVDIFGTPITLDEYNRLTTDTIMYTYKKVKTKSGKIRYKKKSRSPYFRALVSSNAPKRKTPYGTSLNCILGSTNLSYDNDISLAPSGIEAYFNDQLAGEKGICETGYRTNKQTSVTKKEPIDGADLHTTIDMEFQDILDQTALELMARYSPNSVTAAVMEVKTGKIVAITSKELINGQVREGRNHLFSDNFEPGSTIKTISLMAAVDDEAVDAETLINTGTANWRYQRNTIKSHRYGVIPTKEVLAISDNAGVAKIITQEYEQDPDKFVQKIKRFGLDIPLNKEKYREFKGGVYPVIHSPKEKIWKPFTLASMSYGYSLSIPPIYILSIYNTIANGGDFMRPYIVEKIVTKKGKVKYQAKPQVIRKQICSPQTIEQMKIMLREVVISKRGTARALNVDDVEIAGKTGTALVYDEKTRRYLPESEALNYSFCSFFPVDNPRYTVYANMLYPKKDRIHISSARSAGLFSLKIARAEKKRHNKVPFSKSLAYYSKKSKIAGGKAEEVEEFAKQSGYSVTKDKDLKDEQFVSSSLAENDLIELAPMGKYALNKMPNLLGLSLSDAYYMLQRREVKIRIIGRGIVSHQSKPVGSKIRKGETITLTLSKK